MKREPLDWMGLAGLVVGLAGGVFVLIYIMHALFEFFIIAQ